MSAILIHTVDGTTERFEPFKGCISCGSTKIRNMGSGTWGGENTQCGDCGYYKNIDNNNSWAKQGLWTPIVNIDAAGNLKVTNKSGSIIGYFPAGQWKSYREES